MAKTKIKYIGQVTPAELGWSLGDGEPRRIIERGDVIEVTEEEAGRPPFWRPLAKDEPQHAYREHRTADDGTVEVRDLGSGFLAQEINWTTATTSKSTKTEKEG